MKEKFLLSLSHMIRVAGLGGLVASGDRRDRRPDCCVCRW